MFRHLAPAGNTINAHELVRACLAMFSADSPAVFTRKLTTLLNVRHCFLTSSGTAALYLSLVSLRKLAGNNEVVFPAYTCPSVLAAVIRAGLKPVLCDLNRTTSTMDLGDLAGKINPDTLAVISVHLFGIPDDCERINELASSRGLFHIEDAAQSFGLAATDHQHIERSGRFSDVVIVSFGRGKPLSLLQGGALLTDSDAIAEAVREEMRGLRRQDAVDTARLVLQSMIYVFFFHPRAYWIARLMPFLKLGKNIFDPDFQVQEINPFTCALGNMLIDRLPRIIMSRRHKKNLLLQGLSHSNDIVLAGSQDSESLIRFPLVIENHEQRERILSKLEQYGLGATSMYEAPLHLCKDTKQYFPGAVFPNAQSFAERILTLPLHEYVTARDIGATSSIISQACNKIH
jgi:dTDP-4-amino-4,6-dideoxygalactose transaminase